MKTVIPKLHTIGLTPAGQKTYLTFTYEILHNDTGLVETHTVHRDYPYNTIDSTEMYDFVHQYCAQLQETLE